MSVDRCVMCGSVVPEGTQVCLRCQKNGGPLPHETADEMLLALGFRKNTSVCYGEDKGTLLYEKPVMGDTDCLQIYFNKPEVCFYNLMHRSIWMQYGLVNAIQKKMEEMGWDHESN